MKSSKAMLQQASVLCSELDPEDGIDTRRLARTYAHQKQRRKDRQLCREVQRVLNLVFAGEVSDPLLQDLYIESVEGGEQGLPLYIYIQDTQAMDDERRNALLESLHKIQGYLRCAIAQSVNRKKVPALQFRLGSIVQGE